MSEQLQFCFISEESRALINAFPHLHDAELLKVAKAFLLGNFKALAVEELPIEQKIVLGCKLINASTQLLKAMQDPAFVTQALEIVVADMIKHADSDEVKLFLQRYLTRDETL